MLILTMQTYFTAVVCAKEVFSFDVSDFDH